MKIIKETDSGSILETIKILKSGGIVSFATETVYALACDARNDIAVKKLYKIKQRQTSKPISLIVKNLATIRKNFILSREEEIVANKFMPGAITLILQKKDNVNNLSSLMNEGSNIFGVRIPNHPFTLLLLNEFNFMIAATSCNISNQKPAISTLDVINYFNEEIDLLIDGGTCAEKIASTVVKINNKQHVEILREGLITKNQILESILMLNETLENSTLE